MPPLRHYAQGHTPDGQQLVASICNNWLVAYLPKSKQFVEFRVDEVETDNGTSACQICASACYIVHAVQLDITAEGICVMRDQRRSEQPDNTGSAARLLREGVTVKVFHWKDLRWKKQKEQEKQARDPEKATEQTQAVTLCMIVCGEECEVARIDHGRAYGPDGRCAFCKGDPGGDCSDPDETPIGRYFRDNEEATTCPCCGCSGAPIC